MSRRLVFFLVSLFCVWDFATPVVPTAQAIEWDEEEEVVRTNQSAPGRPSGASRRLASEDPAAAGIKTRLLARMARPASRSASAPVRHPRARPDAAPVDSPSEDH